jgi:hypothetical protein
MRGASIRCGRAVIRDSAQTGNRGQELMGQAIARFNKERIRVGFWTMLLLSLCFTELISWLRVRCVNNVEKCRDSL